MSENQRNTTSNESEAAATAGDADVETAEPTLEGSSEGSSAATGTESGATTVTTEAEPEPEEPQEPAEPASAGPSAVKASLASRKAHLTVSRVEPWSVMKFSFVVALVCFIVLFVAVAVIYATLSMLGVFDELTSMINALLEGDGGEDELGLNPAAWFSPGRVLGYTGVIGALNVVLITALSTVGAMLYNLVSDLVGGVDVTLSEAE
ncbi:DUF3566 domain-containing protein [Nocardiopsis ganjiahuensis]|uniref:DUF3566 domain-containing protein n=1 Tax=Nocardiopsis ganjiahuensis TaxID=239984 RepID=UPI000344A1B1|nr:DUF3566 domain-containing protein [Nocardiopsis ganjiahuensis]